jgi:hypothetical protein
VLVLKAIVIQAINIAITAYDLLLDTLLENIVEYNLSMASINYYMANIIRLSDHY